MGSRWKVSLIVGWPGLILSGRVVAFQLDSSNWSYQANPMGADWHVCPNGIPGDGVQRTKDGAVVWNYAGFTFTFGNDACLSGGQYPRSNGVNQVDFGGGFAPGVLAQTTVFFTNASGNTVECDAGASGTGVFSVATINVGASGTIMAVPETGGASLPMSGVLCETNPTTGSCLASPASSVTTQINTNATPTFGVFVTTSGPVTFDPASNRIVVRFLDSGGVTRGATSVAVRTQ